MTDRDKPAAPLNQILYGPPGTGKTYATVDAALEILAPDLLNSYQEDRAVLKAQFDSLVAAGHIRFVTFHQSFSYEDFVEGLRADKGDDGQLRYDVADGVFKSLCEAAAVKITKQAEVPIDLDLTKGRVWKMSLGDSLGSDSYIFDECIKHGYALLGWGKMVDFSGCHTKEEIHKRLLDSGHQVAEDTYMVRAVNTFVLKMKVGDLIVVSEGNTKFRAVGQITGNYRYIQRGELDDGYGQCRDVQWLRVYKPSLPSDQLMNNRFSQMTLYELHSDSIDMEKLMGLLHAQTPLNSALATRSPFHPGEAFGSGYKVVKASNEILELEKPNGSELAFSMRLLGVLANHVNNGQLSLDDIREKRVFDKLPDSKLERYIVNGYNNVLPSLVERLIGRNDPSILHLNTEPAPTAKVLIIDEINRGNVSRIFGELITLIEPSKRAGEPEALEVTLPYSKKRFSIPNNLYLIGTMNTADRSLAGLDIALRRRFDFREFPPKPELLDDTTVSGVNVGQMLRIINERIELLLDRDHCLGHAYFMSLKENPTIDELRNIFRLKIIPLLEEYFFEDWQRIQWVLNDHRKAYSYQFIRKPITNTEALFGDKVSANDHALRWEINETAFTNPDAYAEIVNASAIGDK